MNIPKPINYKQIVEELIETILFQRHITLTKLQIGGLKKHNAEYYLGRKKCEELILLFLEKKLNKTIISKEKEDVQIDSSIVIQAMKDNII